MLDLGAEPFPAAAKCHLRPLARESPGGGPANARCGPGDQNDLAVETTGGVDQRRRRRAGRMGEGGAAHETGRRADRDPAGRTDHRPAPWIARLVLCLHRKLPVDPRPYD
jgi:hypothetical protein